MSGKNDFVMQPLHKRLNRGNIVSRIEEVENRTDARPSERVDAVGQISPDTGDMTITSLTVVNHDTGLGDVVINQYGILFRNQEGEVIFQDTAGGSTLAMYSDADNWIVLANQFGGKGVSFLLDDALHNVSQIDFDGDGNIDLASGAEYRIGGEAAFASGTYTPTLTNVTNVTTSAVIGTFKYSRVGNIVNGAGTMNITPTAGSGTTQVDFTLPIASAFTLNSHASGNGASQATNVAGNVIADATNDRASLVFQSPTTSLMPWRVIFMYEII